MKHVCSLFVWIAAGFLPSVQDVPAADVDYARDVRPILAEHCVSCHGARTQKGALRLDAGILILRGGDSGAAVESAKPGESLLLQRVTTSDPETRMPKGSEPLSAEETELIRRWIEQGATVPEDEPIPGDPREHWAWQNPVASEPLAASQNAIDVYFDRIHEQRGVTPRPEARKEHLLRRVYLDLIGLPPTRDELHAFLAEESPEAYEQIVDRLLDSPHYGERWGRHWMDVWRYTDWFGLGKEVRFSQKHIWRWRDWIIESLNEDAGYDRMIIDMLAADEVAADDPNRLRANGFLTRNWHLFNRNFWLDDTVEHTAKAFLGLTLNCCRCHEHKYDPFSQEEYYQFRAFFEPHDVRLDPVPGQPDLDKDGISRVYDAKLDAKTYLFIQGDEKNIDKTRELSPRIPAFLGAFADPIQPANLPVLGWYPSLRPAAVDAALADVDGRIESVRDQIAQAETLLKSERSRLAELVSGKAADKLEGVVSDDFKAPRPETWEATLTTWKYESGRLINENPEGGQARYECKVLPPRDFAARMRFRLTAGATRSVGIAFDVDERGQVGVYMSPSGHKVAVYELFDGGETYPALAKQRVDNGETYELAIAVRDRLVNVWVNGEFRFAYERKAERRGGRIALTTYQANAEFFHASFSPLDPDHPMFRELVAGKNSSPPQTIATPDGLRRSITRLETQLATNQQQLNVHALERASISARAFAERVRYGLESGSVDETAKSAARAEREQKVAGAILAVRRATAALSLAERDAGDNVDDDASVLKARKDLDATKQRLAMAQQKDRETGTDYTPLGKQFPKQSSGRRSALARWIASPSNPLTSRVAVNHIWTRHFGQPLVGSMFDFGVRTSRPEHAELLDHLAVEFTASGWSMKMLHRRIVLSRAYRRDSVIETDSPAEAADPDNHLYRRMNVRRMEAEILRDSVLQLAGKLDRKLGGPDFPSSEAATGNRRTIYYRYARDDKYTMLDTFDAPSVEECYRRTETIIPQQSLAMINGQLVQSLSREVGGKIPLETPDEFVRAAFEVILCRAPSDQEQRVTRAALEELTNQFVRQGQTAAAANKQAREHIAHVLIMHNDFVGIR